MSNITNLEISKRIREVVTNGQAAVDWVQENAQDQSLLKLLVVSGFYPYLECLVILQTGFQDLNLETREHLEILEEAEGMLYEIERQIGRLVMLQQQSAD